MVTDRYAVTYLPAIIRSEHDSAFEALAALDLPRGDAMNLIVANWGRNGAAIVSTVDGGRPVAAIPLPDGRWAACNAFPEHAANTRAEAERSLSRLLKRGRRGIVAEVPCATSA